MLASAEPRPVQQIAQQLGVSRPTVWRWQQRFAEQGVEGLLRDKTRRPGKAPISADTVVQVVALTCGSPPGETTHWTGRAMARAMGLSLRSVQRIWQAHRLQPHRVRSFKRSRDGSVRVRAGDWPAGVAPAIAPPLSGGVDEDVVYRMRVSGHYRAI